MPTTPPPKKKNIWSVSKEHWMTRSRNNLTGYGGLRKKKRIKYKYLQVVLRSSIMDTISTPNEKL